MPGPALARAVRLRRLAVPQKDEILRRKLYGLLHAHVSADRARREWGERDRSVLNAVARHTLGHPRMTRLDALLYVADYSSPDRRYAGAARVRRLASHSLEEALRETVRGKLLHAAASGGYLHPAAVRLWNALPGSRP